MDRKDDSFDWQEVDDETVKIRMLSQSLGGEARNWFKNLTPNNIHDLHAFHQLFLNKWEVKKNPLQILS